MATRDSSFTADNLKLDEILELYEKQYEELPDKKITRDNDEINTIKMDSKRILPFIKHLTESERDLFRKDLERVLNDLPLIYVQSMSEIVGFLMYFYHTKNKHRESLVSVEERENTTSAVNFEYTTRKKTSLFDPELYDIMLRTIYNILKHKYTPLIEQKFNLYICYNNIFLKLMKKRGIKASSTKSMVYTNSTLTWFNRSLDKIDDVYKVFAIIISCPLNTVFLLLIHYFNEIDNKEKITLEHKSIIPELVKLEQEFIKIEEEGNNPSSKGKRGIALAIAAGAVVTGAIIFKSFNKK